LAIYPAYLSQQFRWDKEAEFFNLIEPSFLTQAGYDVFGNDHLELIPHLATLSDPFVQQIGFALKTSLKLMEKRSSICRCDRPCFVHLLARYSTHSRQIKSIAGGFTQAQWKQIVDFIHANLDRNIHLTELAELVQFSSYHFFTCVQEINPYISHQYLFVAESNGLSN